MGNENSSYINNNQESKIKSATNNNLNKCLTVSLEAGSYCCQQH